MPFEDRQDAGRRVGEALVSYQDGDTLVLAIPRGGVEVGYEVAKRLNAPLSVLVARKLPLPNNPEAGFGAVAEDGSVYLTEDARYMFSEGDIQRIVEAQKREIRRRIAALRGGQPLPRIHGRTVILVDDGIAMGSTLRASVACCRNYGAGKVVVAVPVASSRAKAAFEELADDLVVLETPMGFRAVAQVYRNWYDVPGEEAQRILQAAGQRTE